MIFKNTIKNIVTSSNDMNLKNKYDTGIKLFRN